MRQLGVVWGRVALASVVMLALALPMQATVVATYSDRASWEAGLTSVTTADFNETLSNSTYQLYSNSAGYTSGIFNFLGIAVDPATYELKRLADSGEQWLVGPSWINTSVNSRVVINLANSANAFGIDIASSVAGISYQITVSPTETFTVVAPQRPSTTFFGVRTDTPIGQITIRMISSGGLPAFGDESRFDNASAGFFTEEEPPTEPSETPETSTYIYGATGLLLLAWTRHRR